MYPHSRRTRNRREFVRDAFCGFGGLALASILHEEEAGEPRRFARPQGTSRASEGEVGDLPVHGRRPESPGDV